MDIQVIKLPNGGTEYRSERANIIRDPNGHIRYQRYESLPDLEALLPRVLNTEEWNQYAEQRYSEYQAVAREQNIVDEHGDPVADAILSGGCLVWGVLVVGTLAVSAAGAWLVL